MIRCGFEQGAALMGCTSVQNIFILEYMPKAPELYCKVYLFGLMQCGCRRLENADLCASLGIDSAKAVEAFLYWQDMGLLRIVEQEPLSVEYLSVQAGPVTGGTRSGCQPRRHSSPMVGFWVQRIGAPRPSWA